MTRPSYFLKMTFRNISRNLVLNLVASASISMSLLILGGFLLINVNLQKIIESSSQGLAVSVYLKDGLSPAAVEKLRKDAAALEGVKSVVYISQDRAWAELKERLGDQSSILEGLDRNPLPASLELEIDPKIRREERIQALSASLRALKGVDEIVYAWEWARKLLGFVNFVRAAGFVIGGMLFLAVVFITANTIKLTVMARADELYIMRLMGATEGFIRTPFILEGVLQGLFGGLASLSVLYVFFRLLYTQVELPLGLTMMKLSFLPASQSLFLILSGIGLGLAGSLISLGRFMPK
ncbi:MAG: permease-like cell division protein FtsX [Pseudomonadota bacterium]